MQDPHATGPAARQTFRGDIPPDFNFLIEKKKKKQQWNLSEKSPLSWLRIRTFLQATSAKRVYEYMDTNGAQKWSVVLRRKTSHKIFL
jgi:hypothetical protein